MEQKQQTRLGSLLSEIAEFYPTISELRDSFRSRIADLEQDDPDNQLKDSGPYWVFIAYMDVMTRLKPILEQNFKFVETLGVLSISRYIFELLVWLRLLDQNASYGLIYKFQLMEKQIKYYEDFIAKARLEINRFNQLAEEEKSQLENIAKAAIQNRDKYSKEYIARYIRELQQEIDRKARRTISIYADQAKTNGYSFQAFLIESKVLPELHSLLDRCKAERTTALKNVKVRPPVGTNWERQDQSWKWKEQARNCGMSEQYEFIYYFTSRLLHATPVSLTTNQKLLEPDEMILFLDYIYVSVFDIAELAKKRLGIPLVETGLH